MLRRHHRFFQSLQVLRDVLLVGAAFALAYAARFSFPALMPYRVVSEPREALIVGTFLLVLWPAAGWASGLYVSRRSRSLAAEVYDVFKVSIVAFAVVVTLTYFTRDERFSRGIMVLWTLFSFVLVSSARMSSRFVLRRLRSMGFNLRHVVVVGNGDLAQSVVDIMHQQTSLGMHVIGSVEPMDGTAAGQRATLRDTPMLGTVSEMADIIRRHTVDQVIVALSIEQLGALKQLMQVLSQEPVDVRVVPDFYQYMTLCGSVEEFSGLPIINLQATPLVGWNLVAKRSFDILAAGLGLLTTWPALVAIAAAVRLGSRGPVFYSQMRVGMDGREFRMLKFRTMRVDAEAAGAQMTTADDPRRTRVGSFLRRTSLDELPQLFNVLRGDMSLVGPRPERPCFIEDFKREIPRYALRHKIKAGMTGWAQVNGLRGATSIEERVKLDLYYIENWSLTLDFKILVRTVLGGFLSPHAY
ncbi:MAG: undecaprenyl-phosphate glucose phosphotransferase [Myxococcota bacterium]